MKPDHEDRPSYGGWPFATSRKDVFLLVLAICLAFLVHIMLS